MKDFPVSQSPPRAASNPAIAYHDNWLDRAFIGLFSRKIAQALASAPPTAKSGKAGTAAQTNLQGYDRFVALSHQIMQGRNAQQQQEVVARVLGSLVPSPVLWGIRTLFSPTQWVCESNAWFAAKLFEWLVGPCELRQVEIQSAGLVKLQTSQVHIQKCRYLEQSNCVGMCINMCKLPTQTFFTEGFGIPLTMTPNFEDFSCEMVFGQAPPPLEQEDCAQQPCLAVSCPSASPAATPCHKLPIARW